MPQTRSNSETKEDEIGVLETKPGLVGRIEELCQIIDEKEGRVKLRKEELHNMEVEVEVEVYEMKQEIATLQAKLEGDLAEENELISLKKAAGRGWRNSVMERRIYGRLTKSAKREAEDWARQTKRTLVMEMIKHRKHSWISRPRRQASDPLDSVVGLGYEEHSGIMEMELDSRIIPTMSFEEIKMQIEEKWKEEIRVKIKEVSVKKDESLLLLDQQLEKVQAQAEKEKESIQKEHDNNMYGLTQLLELLGKMLTSDRSSTEDASACAAIWKTEFECPICFEEMKPPMRIWQCVDGHAICAGCRDKLESKGCPSCSRSIDGRNFTLEKMARSLFGEDIC